MNLLPNAPRTPERAQVPRRSQLAVRWPTETELRLTLLGIRAQSALWGWLLPIAIAVIGGALRFFRLGEPHTLIFDETYYVKDAYSYLFGGFERNWPDEPNDSFENGDQHIFLDEPEYAVHPPVGKWMIAAGLKIFGTDSSFGWRFAAAVVGTLSILMIARIARRLFGSTLLGATAGILLAVDGEHFVHSRTSLLDVFLMFWVLAAFGALLIDRDQSRIRLSRLMAGWYRAHPFGRRADDGTPTWTLGWWGPGLGLRPWRIVAGLCLGLALGTKWSALYFIVAFGLMTVLWDVGARRAAGVIPYLRATAIKDGIPAFISIVPVALLSYLASWTGWIRSSGGYDRQWAAEHPGHPADWLPDWLVSLAHYHFTTYGFHVGLSSDHPYKSNPWGWLVQWRPTSFYYESYGSGDAGCEAEKCSAAITSLGNPMLWWLGVIALLVCIGAWALRRDWRAGAICAGFAAGYLPWFQYQDRTIYTFYTIVFTPFVVLAVTYLLGLILGPEQRANAVGPELLRRFTARPAPPARRLWGALAAGLIVAIIVITFAYFYPIYSAQVIPYQSWNERMWLVTWI
ncbi:glycosyltransferase family 39 protein [Saxibacter everestensis]|uniref:Polyprenol-phosphate-mannose--protein mannosyltransferase n=1 Tax=Saxibacter everestensis TaxID=2909229 RepID=A0ABY8QX59_9MICO|nr:glycosyltransferase family 39 protein [Brevibacteriaceae bacterium ZFBP1038]